MPDVRLCCDGKQTRQLGALGGKKTLRMELQCQASEYAQMLQSCAYIAGAAAVCLRSLSLTPPLLRAAFSGCLLRCTALHTAQSVLLMNVCIRAGASLELRNLTLVLRQLSGPVTDTSDETDAAALSPDTFLASLDWAPAFRALPGGALALRDVDVVLPAQAYVGLMESMCGLAWAFSEAIAWVRGTLHAA